MRAIRLIIGLTCLLLGTIVTGQSNLAPFTKKQQEKLDSLTSLLSAGLTSKDRFSIHKKIVHHTYIRKPQVARVYIDSLYTFAKEEKDSIYCFDAKIWESNMLHRHASYEEAILGYKISIPFMMREGRLTRAARSAYYLGDAYFQIGNMDKAVATFLSSVKLSKEAKLPIEEQLSSIKLGRVYRELGEFELSLDYLDKAEALHQDIPEMRYQKRLVNTLMNKGLTYGEMQKWDEAIATYERAKQIIGDGPLIPQYHIIQSYLSDAYVAKGDLVRAEACALDAMEFFDKRKINHQGMAKARKNRAKIFLKKGDLEAARTMGEEMLAIAQENKMLFKELLARELLMEIEEAAGNYQASLEQSRQVSLLKDSILNKASNEKIQELTIAYDTEQKNEQIKRLALEDELKAARLFNQRIWIWGLLISLSLLTFLLLKYNKQNKEIADQNEIIHDNLKEKEILLMEIHHRVKNNLQMISSLLSLQTRSLSDPGAIEALEEGQSRVDSMALIHQHLYTEDALTGVKMKDYIKNLCQRVFDSHQISTQQVSLDVQIDDVQLDIKTVVPIGLILNELITNVCKYAFPNEQNGNLAISLKDKDDVLLLSVADDGVGHQKKAINKGFGSRLIKTLAKKMDADISEFHEKGYRIDFKIKHYQKS